MNPAKRSLLTLFLLPFSWIYGAGVIIRNWLFDLQLLKSKRFPIPVICIGNLSVGGTGKTPHTEYLIRLLEQEFKIAVLSRGYKRKSKGFVLASPQTTIEQIGDEPYQMANKFQNIYMAVDRNRCHGIESLTNGMLSPQAEVILLDDAFQHRYVQPGLSILLIDYNRPIYSDYLLPAGRLREPVSGKKRANIILVTKCPESLSAEERIKISKRISPSPEQSLYFTRFTYDSLYSLSSSASKRELTSITSDEEILLVTGIASPRPLIRELNTYTQKVYPLTFADHHNFTAEDINKIRNRFEQLSPQKRLIITTEKDAARLTNHPQLDNRLKENIYVLPIRVEFLDESDQSFNLKIIEYVRKNSRNSILLKK